MMVSEADDEVADEAVISADVAVATDDVEMVKVPVVCPWAIVMLAGTVAAPLLLDRFTCTPPKAAGTARVTVPVADWPPVTVSGLMLTPVMAPVPSATGLITAVVDTELAEFAVMVAMTERVTEEVATVKLPLDCPCGTMMLAGTVAAALLLARFTSTPPVPAGAASVTVPVAFWPAVIIAGLTLTLERLAVDGPDGLTVREAEVELAEVAVIRTAVALDTEEVETANVPLD